MTRTKIVVTDVTDVIRRRKIRYCRKLSNKGRVLVLVAAGVLVLEVVEVLVAEVSPPPTLGQCVHARPGPAVVDKAVEEDGVEAEQEDAGGGDGDDDDGRQLAALLQHRLDHRVSRPRWWRA